MTSMESDSYPAILIEDQGNTYFHEELVRLIEIKCPLDILIPILKNTNIWNQCDSFGNTLLHIAAQHDHHNLLNYFIERGSRIDVQNNLGKTSLIIAIENHNGKSLEILLKNNANLFISDNSGKNALQWFLDVQWSKTLAYRTRAILRKVESQCLGNNEEIANQLIAVGWPLHCAILLKNVKVTEMMLNHGCKVDTRDAKHGRTALHMAVMWRSFKCVKLLLDNNADPNMQDNWHRTPLHYINRNEQHTNERVEMVKLLIDRGAVLITSDGTSTWTQVSWLLNCANRQIIEILLQANLAQLLDNQEESHFPLHDLATNNNPDVFEAFVGYSFNVDSRNSSGDTPLMIAASYGHVSAVRFLLERGADVNAISARGDSSLHRCVNGLPSFKDQHEDCIQLLLEYDANVALQASNGSSIFDIVRDTEVLKSVSELLIAHVVLQKALGKHVAEFVYQKIYSHQPFNLYYNFYMKHLVTELHGSVTLLDLLKAGDSRFERYVRNQELASSIERFSEEWQTKLRYFITILQKRYSKAVRLIKLRKEAAPHLFQIMKTGYSRYPSIADQIVSYLDQQDLQSILQVPI